MCVYFIHVHVLCVYFAYTYLYIYSWPLSKSTMSFLSLLIQSYINLTNFSLTLHIHRFFIFTSFSQHGYLLVELSLFWGHTWSAQGLLLCLCSGIPSGRAQRTVSGARNQTRVGFVQGKWPALYVVSPLDGYLF